MHEKIKEEEAKHTMRSVTLKGMSHYLCRGGGWEKNVGHVKFSMWPP